ncbi:hypothetical protein [Nocardioides maradonensis]
MDDFLRPFSGSLDDQVTDAAVRLLAGAGVSRFSMGTIAAGISMTRQGLTHRLKLEIDEQRSQSPPPIYLHEMIVARFGQRFRAWASSDFFRSAEGLPPRLAVPSTPDQRNAVRIWLGLRELARSDWEDGEPGTADEVAASDTELRRLLRGAIQLWTGRPFSSTATSRLLALADGIQLATVSPIAPMSGAIARTILDREIAELVGGRPFWADPAA